MIGQIQGDRRAVKLARLAVSTIFFINGVIIATWASRIPAIQAKLALPNGILGLALLSAAVGALISMNLSGYLSARVGSKPVTIITSLCLCLALPLLALAPNLPLLVISLFIYGACNSSMDVSMNTQGAVVEQQYGKTIFNSFHACFSLGGLAGAGLSGGLAGAGLDPITNFTGVAIVSAILITMCSRALLATPTEEAGTTFARPTRALLALGLISFCSLISEGAMVDWSAVYLTQSIHVGAGLATAGYAAFSLFMAGGRAVGDFLEGRLGSPIMIRSGGLIAACGLVTALLFHWAPVVILGIGLVGAGLSVIFPLVLSAAGHASNQSSGTAIASVATCGYFGFLVGPPVIGFLSQALNLQIALSFVVLLNLTAAFLAPATNNLKKSRLNQATISNETEITV